VHISLLIIEKKSRNINTIKYKKACKMFTKILD